MCRLRPSLICYVLVAFFSCATFASGNALEIQAIRVPDGGLDPQAQTDSRGRIHLIYFKGDPRHGDIFYVRSDDGAATFTAPIRVNSQPGSAIIIGTIRGPHLAIGRGDRVHVAWMGSDRAQPKVNAKAPMLYTRLSAAGDSFEPQRNVIRAHPGLDGGGSVAADKEGDVYVAWHAPQSGDDEADRQVWISRSRDDGASFDDEIAAIPSSTGVCGCCGLNIIATGKGYVFVVFRSATEMVHRDVHVLASKDFGQTFQIVKTDPWRVARCVMSTASLARCGDNLLAAWETEGQIRLATLRLDNSDAKVVSMPGESKQRKHPAIAVNAQGERLLVWAEGTGWEKGGDVAWQFFNANGEAGGTGRLHGLQPWSVPAAIVAPDGSFKVIY